MALAESLRRRGGAALAVTALALGGVAVAARAAVSAPPLPAVTAEELLGSVTQAMAQLPDITGQVSATLELGLPDLALPDADQNPLADAAGDKRLRVWRSGDGLRLADLRDTSERGFITDGNVAWTWDSATLVATRYDLPQHTAPQPSLGAQLGDPLELARRGLQALDASTEVTLDRTGRVAGRDTYRLVLTPRSATTLVGRIELDIDAARRLPLRAAVFARGAAAPSIETAYTEVSFEAIDPAVFAFVPPPQATVAQGDAGWGARPPVGEMSGDPGVQSIGSGWETVVAVPAPDLPTQASALLPFSGPLFSARVQEGWLLFGTVPQSVLQDAADGDGLQAHSSQGI